MESCDLRHQRWAAKMEGLSLLEAATAGDSSSTARSSFLCKTYRPWFESGVSPRNSMALGGDPTGLRGIDEDQTLIPNFQGLRTLCWGRSRKADRNIQYTHRISTKIAL